MTKDTAANCLCWQIISSTRQKIFRVGLLVRSPRNRSRGGSRVGNWGDSPPPPKTYESNFIHHDFVQFRKRHSRYKAYSSSIVLSQQCCEVCFISLYTVVKPSSDLTTKHYWNTPIKFTGWIRPWIVVYKLWVRCVRKDGGNKQLHNLCAMLCRSCEERFRDALSYVECDRNGRW